MAGVPWGAQCPNGVWGVLELPSFVVQAADFAAFIRAVCFLGASFCKSSQNLVFVCCPAGLEPQRPQWSPGPGGPPAPLVSMVAGVPWGAQCPNGALGGP